MTVIAPKNIELIIVDDSTVRVAGTRSSLRIRDVLEGPLARIYIISVKVIYSVKAVISTKNVYLALVNYSGMSISRGGRRVVNRENFGPLVSLEIKLKEVISSVGAVVASKDVKIVVKGHRGMQGPRTRWMVLIILLVVDGVP